MANAAEDFSQFGISKEEKDKLVGEVIQYMHFKTHQNSGCPIKRDVLTQLVSKNYHQLNLPTFVINEAKKKLSTIFGYEMRELQRSLPSSKTQARFSQQKGLWSQMRRMGLDENEANNPILGNIKQALELLVQQRYLQKDKVSGPEGNTTY